jgi:hypothetical protein
MWLAANVFECVSILINCGHPTPPKVIPKAARNVAMLHPTPQGDALMLIPDHDIHKLGITAKNTCQNALTRNERFKSSFYKLIRTPPFENPVDEKQVCCTKS